MSSIHTNLVTMVHKGVTVYTKGFDDLKDAIATAKSLALGGEIIETITEDREWKCENDTVVKIDVI